MNAKMFARAFVFLTLLFAVLYTGMSNPQRVDFHFPLLLERKVSQPAAILFFAMFAVGVFAGMLLNAGSPAKGADAPSKRK